MLRCGVIQVPLDSVRIASQISQTPAYLGSGLARGAPFCGSGGRPAAALGLDPRSPVDEVGPLQRQLLWRGEDPGTAHAILAARSVQAAILNEVLPLASATVRVH